MRYSYLQIEKYIADKITSLCEKRDISKYRLSQLSGISQSSLGRIITQENLPSLIALEKICTALGVTLSQFFHTFKSYNKKIGKTDESLRRKAIGPVKWQPVATSKMHCLQ